MAIVDGAARPPRLGDAPVPRLGRVPGPTWLRRYVRGLVAGDAVCIAAATTLAASAWPEQDAGSLHGLWRASAAGAVALGWLLALAADRAYAARHLGCGSEEYRRVVGASLYMLAALTATAFPLRSMPVWPPVGVGLLVGTGLLVVHRFAARRLLYRRRARGQAMHRVLAVGTPSATRSLADAFAREPHAGFRVVGVCLTGADDALPTFPDDVASDASEVLRAALQLGADVIAATASAGVTPQLLRSLAWQLEGRSITLVVAPALTDVAGPRVAVRPVAGLPLLHVEQPEITGARYTLKQGVGRAAAVVALALALPFMLGIAVAVKFSSPGPVLFRQTRITRGGRPFRILKFRTMHADAETLLADLRQRADGANGPLFKLRADPRVTRVGRWLRRFSLDELPQLVNVIRGDMALVGPRPLLPHEVAAYPDDAWRRMLVKPGMTGLWQVSGRSDLSWAESVRLDLYYVEHWSLALDIQIMVRTVRAVLRGAGAY